MTSVQQEALPRDAISAVRAAEAPQTITMDIKSEGGRITKEEFIFGQLLGVGAYSACHEVKQISTTSVFACKICPRAKLASESSRQRLLTEISIHKSVVHKHIVRFHMIGCDSENYFLLLEKCNNRSLRQVMKSRLKVTENEVRYWMAQLLDALDYLHSHQICHRDLKLDNIFLHDRQVKLGDFGFSVRLGPNMTTKTFCGTPNYIAPEVVARTEYSFPVDVWAVGILIYTMIYGTPPFETASATTTYQKITDGDYAFPEVDDSSEEVKDVIRLCLQHHPSDRPTCAELLTHPFFSPHLIPASLPSNALGFSTNATQHFTSANVNPISKKRTRNADTAHIDAMGAVPVAKRFVGLTENKENTGFNTNRTPNAAHTTSRTAGLAATPQNGTAHHTASAGHVTEHAAPHSGATAAVNAPHTTAASGQGLGTRNGTNTGSAVSLAVSPTNRPPTKVETVPWKHDHHQSTLKRLVVRLREIASQEPIVSVPKVPPPCVTPHDAHRLGHHCIVKWLDYSQRFGLSFQFCDNTTGVLFVDYSFLITKAGSNKIIYGKKLGAIAAATPGQSGGGLPRFSSATVTRTIYEEFDLAVHRPVIESRVHLKNRVELLDIFTEYMKDKLAASSGLAMLCSDSHPHNDSVMIVDPPTDVPVKTPPKAMRAPALYPKRGHSTAKSKAPAAEPAVELPKAALHKHAAIEGRKDMIGVLCWVRTDDAIMFLFTNYTVQINFYDHVKIVMTLPDLKAKPEATELITIVSEKGVGVTRTVQQILDGGVLTASLIDKLKFAADNITTHFINMGKSS